MTASAPLRTSPPSFRQPNVRLSFSSVAAAATCQSMCLASLAWQWGGGQRIFMKRRRQTHPDQIDHLVQVIYDHPVSAICQLR